MDIMSTLVLLLVGGGILVWVASPSTAQALDAFGSGFIGYRAEGWPKGVQEEEPVQFSFAEPRRAASEDDAGLAPFEAEPEIVELSDPIDKLSVRLERIR